MGGIVDRPDPEMKWMVPSGRVLKASTESNNRIRTSLSGEIFTAVNLYYRRQTQFVASFAHTHTRRYDVK